MERQGIPPEIEIIAETEEGLIMGIRHRRFPWLGVQFHPESILTPVGPRIVENFLGLAAPERARSLSSAGLVPGR